MDCKLPIQDMIFWHKWYIRNPKWGTYSRTNLEMVQWLGEQIADRRLYKGIICS